MQPGAALMSYWVVLGALAGLIAGSFLSTLVVRWPGGKGLGGRSACDDCGQSLKAIELVPLLSYAVQRGRCRSCGTTIAAVHPVMEIMCTLAGGAALSFGPSAEAWIAAAAAWLLVALAMLDLRHLWLPDKLTLALALVAGGGGMLFAIPPAPVDRIIGGAAGFLSLALVAWGYRVLRNRDGLGGGDPKLFGAIGLWLGWQALPLVLLAATFIALLGVALLALRGARVDATLRVPLGSALAVAAIGYWFVSRAI